jgi:hypothetical protein
MWDGVALWSTQRVPGAIYLLGYHAEMTLKCAYFRLRGEPANFLVDRKVLNTTAARARALGVGTRDENFHSLLFWRDTLRAERRARGRPLQNQLDQELHHHVDVVHGRWRVEMRYRPTNLALHDLELSMAAVDWLDRNYPRLYS